MNIVFNKKNNVTEVDIIGDIGQGWFSEGHTLKSVKAEFDKIDTPEVVLNIDSLGGDVSDGFAIHDLIKSHKANVTAKIIGWTASAGTIVAMGADKVEISENSFFLIHNTWTGVVGNAKQLREMASELDKFDNKLVRIYENKTGLEGGEIREIMEKEEWLSAETAQEKGFVDVVIQPVKAAASVSNKELIKAGLPQVPENLTKTINKMSTEETTVEATEVSKLEGLLNKFTDAIKNVVESYSSKPEEVKILDHAEVSPLLDTLKKDLETATNRQSEIDVLNAKIEELETKLASNAAGEVEVINSVEPEIETSEKKEESNWDMVANLVKNRGWVGKV